MHQASGLTNSCCVKTLRPHVKCHVVSLTRMYPWAETTRNFFKSDTSLKITLARTQSCLLFILEIENSTLMGPWRVCRESISPGNFKHNFLSAFLWDKSLLLLIIFFLKSGTPLYYSLPAYLCILDLLEPSLVHLILFGKRTEVWVLAQTLCLLVLDQFQIIVTNVKIFHGDGKKYK